MASRRLEIEIVGDASKLNKELDAAQKSTGSFASKFKSAGLVIGAGLAVVGIGLKKSADAAIESEKAQARLAQAMQSAGIDAEKFGSQIERSIQATSKLSAFDDEDLSDQFAKLARTTGDVAKATEGMGLAADIARARNISLEAAGKLVEKAMLGNEQAFKKVGVAMEKGATINETLAKAQEKFGGAAEAYGKSAAGAQERFGVAVENLQEKIGAKLLPVLAKLMEVALKVIDSIERNWPKIMAVIGPVMDDVREVIADTTEAIQRIWDEHGKEIMAVVTFVFGTIQRAVENVMRIIQGVIDVAMGILTGDWDRAWNGIKNIVGGVFDAIGTLMGTALTLLGAAATKIGTAIKDGVVNAVTGLAGAVWNLINNIGERINAEIASIIGWGTGIGAKVKQAVVDALVGIGTGAWNVINNIWTVISEAASTITGWGSDIGDKIKAAVVAALVGIGTAAWNIINNIGSVINDVAKTIAGWGGDVARFIKNGIVDGLKGIGNTIWEKIKDAWDWVKGKLPNLPDLNPFGDPADPNFTGPTGPVMGNPPAPGSLNLMGANPEMMPFASAASQFGLQVTSGLRPGAITANGTLSDHARGKALDVSNGYGTPQMASFFKSLVGNRSVKQAFYDPLGSIFGGALSSYREGGHTDHVHVATYDKGGWLLPGLTLAKNDTGRPEAILTASQLARSGGGRVIALHVHIEGPVYSDDIDRLAQQIYPALARVDRSHGGRFLNYGAPALT